MKVNEQMMRREEIERHCTDGTENCSEERFEKLVSMALASGKIYDKAIEDAAQMIEYHKYERLADYIRDLKGTFNG